MRPSAYHPDFGTTVHYEFEAMPDDPDAQVKQTMRKVIRYLRADACSEIIRDQARHALRLGAGPGRTYAEQCITGVWRLVRGSMRFKPDEDIARDLAIDDPRKADVVEVLIRPIDQALLIALRGVGVEDCDGFEMYAACLFTALGVPCKLVTVSAEPERPHQFSHVYLAVYTGGQRIPLDFSHGKYPGWECPNTGRLREWSLDIGVREILEDALPVLAALLVACTTLYLFQRERHA